MNWLKKQITKHYAKVYTDQFLQGEQMKFLKTHWPGVLHVVALAVLFLSPAVKAYLSSNARYGAIGLVIWAEIMRWAQSPAQPPIVQ